jgi:SPP1 family predicted phage head-tail adaptor
MPLDPLILDVGTMRHSITIQAPSTTRDAFGQSGTTWEPVIQTRASIKQTTARTLYMSGVLSAEASHILRMRYNRNITLAAGYQVLYGPHLYTIVNVDNVQERNRVWELLLLEVDDNG